MRVSEYKPKSKGSHRRGDLDIKPGEHGFGAEMRGVDFAGRLEKATVGAITQACLDYRVLVFPDQVFEADNYVSFARRFGELEASPVLANGRMFVESHPEILVLSNIRDGDYPIGAFGADSYPWHSDSASTEEPPKMNLLYAVEVPEQGGETGFLDMVQACRTMPKALRARVEGCEIKHDASFTIDGYLRDGRGITLETAQARGLFDVRKLPGPTHPIIRTIPETGEEVLYLGKQQNACIVGLELEESETLLDALWTHAESLSKHAFFHHWMQGDLLMWDNRTVMHRRNEFALNARRLLHKIYIRGEVPA